MPLVVKKFKQKRKNDLDMENKEIQSYIRANRKLQEKKNKIISKCMKLINELDINRYNHSFVCVVYIKICEVFLDPHSYFKDSFKPQMCKCGKCNTYVEYNVPKLCKCVLKYINIDDFLSIISDSKLELYLTYFKDVTKAKPILNDITELVKIFDTKIMTEYPIILKWNSEENRFMIKLEE